MPATSVSHVSAETFQRPKRRHLLRYIELKLAALGLPTFGKTSSEEFLSLTDALVKNHQEKARLLSGVLAPVDARIQNFLHNHLADVREYIPEFHFPENTLALDIPGIARELSLPVEGNYYENKYLKSYRLKNGVLHNPLNDRRTTQGVFHVATGGLPVPPDKKAVPKIVFARLLAAAVKPPAENLRLPYLAGQEKPAETFVSLLLRPIVCPEVPGVSPEKTMEVRFVVPGSLVANLDFVESIFGNAGDPQLPENDAALDTDHWTGHTGCVILAPHLRLLKKKDLGLPSYQDATPRLRRDGMCWKSPDELYNDGEAFKITCRTEAGVIVTLIADNYFGYCKKEVKTQISYAANLFGNAEEEHAGGALAYPRYNLGEVFVADSAVLAEGQTYADQVRLHTDFMDPQPEGYAKDRHQATVFYLPENVRFDIHKQTAQWTHEGKERTLKIKPGEAYILPSGYKVHMEPHPTAPSWRLVGTASEGTFCHKPCTVSGGGKSEISKSIRDYCLFGPVFIGDYEEDFEMVEAIIRRDYSDRFLDKEAKKDSPSRPILSAARSLGSVIKLLTPSTTDYTPEYNEWLNSIPDHVKALVFIIKRFYREEWGMEWRKHFSTDLINGTRGHELKFQGRKLVAKYLRVGTTAEGTWRTYKLRQDYLAAQKIQTEDDISASTTVPASVFKYLSPQQTNPSVKLVQNCELRLFQRPDDAIIRGADHTTEKDIAEEDNFLSNFEPLTPEDARKLVEQTISLHQYTDPMRRLVEESAAMEAGTYFVSSAHPRLVGGKPSKNPRYLQKRPDLVNPRERYLAEVGLRLRRRIPPGEAVVQPVNAVLAGRRNNPASKAEGIRPLAVYNPIHFQELPELFMDFICSLTGKSPSTTGAGSEGALTKGPFNALHPSADLNNALVSYIITGYAGYTTAAGCVGPNYRVDHDISLMIPELWCRLSEKERDPYHLIKEGCLEKVEDFQYEGRTVLASRLGYRITAQFLRLYFGRLFDCPTVVFDEKMLKPELQDLATFVDGMENITEAQRGVAEAFFEDGSVDAACPPLRALLHIMAKGTYEGKTAADPEVRRMFTREYLLASPWYHERLATKQNRDVQLWTRHVASLEGFMAKATHQREADRLALAERLRVAKAQLAAVRHPEYLKSLVGTLGADPIYRG